LIDFFLTYPTAWNKLYKREVWEYLRFPENCFYEDLPTTFQTVFHATTFCFTDEVLIHYNLRDGSITKHFSNKQIDDKVKVFELIKHTFKEKSIPSFPALAIVILLFIGAWREKLLKQAQTLKKREIPLPDLTHAQVRNSVIILMFLVFSKNFYTAGISNYFQFYTIKTFGFTNAEAQLYLFYYLGAAAAGTLIGGFFGDRVGRKFIIWFSILGAAPFALWLPYADAKTTAVLVVLIGFIISSAFASILVYAQELLPKKIGMISGVFYGFAFGMAGLGSAVLGKLIDMTSITFVYKVCSFLPLMGLTAYFLPNLRKVKTKLSE